MDDNPKPTDTPQKNAPEAIIQTTSSVTESPEKSKKKARTKIIATIFGTLILVGGVAAGVYLVQRQQELRERAASGRECQQSDDCILLDEPGNQGSYTTPRPITHIFITAKDFHRFDSPGGDNGCYRVTINTNSLSWERYGSGPNCKDVSNVQIWLGERQPQPTPTATPSPAPTSTPTPTKIPGASPTPTPTPSPTPTLPPGISAQCHNVVAYDTEWNLLSSSDLSSVSAGDKVRFAVSGSASSGFFDKARFTINGVTRSDVTAKKPGTNEFYDEYTIPEGVTTFTVSAQVHHSELGWF